MVKGDFECRKYPWHFIMDLAASYACPMLIEVFSAWLDKENCSPSVVGEILYVCNTYERT